MEYVTNDTVQAMTNGTEQQPAFVDNRARIEVDAKQVETWEIMVMEEGNISKALLVFSRYLARNGAPVSPDLPSAPVDELTKAEMAQIRNSEAYRQLKRMKLPMLKQAVQAFVEGAAAGF